jgi:hypothetical protein
MSRQLHLVEVTQEQLQARHKARLVAAAVVIAFFAAFVAFAPGGDTTPAPQPAMTAAAPEKQSAPLEPSP